MDKRVELQHRTVYRYETAVTLGPQLIQLRPAPHCRTPILEYALAVTPAEKLLSWQFDALGNHVARVTFPGKTTELAVKVTLVAEMTPINPFAFLLEPGCEMFPLYYPTQLAENLELYLARPLSTPLLRAFVQEMPSTPQNLVTFVGNATRQVRDRIGYTTRLEHGVQTPEETLALGTGSCRDTAWLLVQVLRSVGLAARFVSGYLIQLTSDEADSPKADSADLHAWAEVFLPGAGWVGLDPTSGFFAAEGHIALACTPTPEQAAPISGTYEPTSIEFEFSVSVRRLGELVGGGLVETDSVDRTPVDLEPVETEPVNLAEPFSEETWRRVRGVAHAIDERLEAQDVRLTMGGEPTYVGVDEPENAEWNLAALGASKRTLGLSLLRRLQQRTAPGGMLHFGQGKWYPGEPLPRWAFQCISRLDGVPVWEDPELFAREEQKTTFGVSDSLRFMQALARRLQVTDDNILAAFEPGSGASDEPTGYVLPLRRRQAAGALAWSSQPWFERPERLVLFPGDSPIGYRITADLVPFVAPEALTYAMEGEGAAARKRLAAWPARRPELFDAVPAADPLPPLSSAADDATELVRPALCVQAVAGRLHVFLPYTPALPDYLDLIAAVEDTCKHLGVTIWLEGYTPPHDPRLRFYGLTPDPGVLEVNLPATESWDALEELTSVLDEEALGNRLIAAKFAYDGSHLSTGGGSHIVLGSRSMGESPVLRRPDLLRSMIAFWQRHPSLSYLFSGMYVGPTSQYPRVDEARVDALYELELAFSQLPQECAPNIVDGLFRNLLVDVTGNTHRAEFCIDKMYPPEGQGLRLGLLELRAFEMAPHFRMGLLQMLLVRALVCVFWKQPYTEPLVRWETMLHDRFMLPHFVQRDFSEVLAYLRAAGLAFEDSWFRAQLQFRFPVIGSVAYEGVTLELRQALEPWNVLAEETSAGGTGRSVDSSLERLQLTLSGAADAGRYVVACNGRRVPLTPSGVAGEAVAGIRYRARRLSAELHPTIPVHTPLVFDVIDTKEQQPVARCTYFAGPPDGSVHTTRPRSAEEASSRRQERFQVAVLPDGAMLDGPMPVPAEEVNPVFAMTLDLRFPSAGRGAA